MAGSGFYEAATTEQCFNQSITHPSFCLSIYICLSVYISFCVPKLIKNKCFKMNELNYEYL